MMASKEESDTKQLKKQKLKQKIKENHEVLSKSDISSLKMAPSSMLSHCVSYVSLDSMSLHSTISSDSGPLTAWEHAWTLNNSHSSQSRRASLSISISSFASLKSSGSSCSSSSHLESDSSKEIPRVDFISDACFLKSGYGVVVAEPNKNRLQVFSKKRHTLLATISDRNKYSKLSESIALACGNNRFNPLSLSETDYEDVVAVSSQNVVIYMRVAGEDSEIEAQTCIKDRRTLSAVEFIGNDRMIVAEAAFKGFLGTYDLGGKLVREFKSLRDLIIQPSVVSWSHDHHVAAVVDASGENILFLDKNGTLLNTFGRRKNACGHLTASQFPIVSRPSGAAWCNPHHLIVADKLDSKLITLDFRNLSYEVSVQSEKCLTNPGVVACNERGNRLLVTEEKSNIQNTAALKLCNLSVDDSRRHKSPKSYFSLKMFQRHGVSKKNGAFNGLFVD